jgi:ABC-type glycerol-3-phosphate transport system permease component
MVTVGPICWVDPGLCCGRLAGRFSDAVLLLQGDPARARRGCGDGRRQFVQRFFRIIVPIALPGFSVTFLLLFIAAWNEFLFAFTLTITPEFRLLTVRLFEVPARGDSNIVPYDLIAAGGMLILLPLVPLLLKVRNQLVEGILAGALKE